MLRPLNKIAGSLIAFVLYPLKSLLISFLLIALTLVLSVIALIGLPIIAAIYAAVNTEINKFAISLIVGFVVAAIALVLVPAFSALILLNLTVGGIKDLFRSASFGLFDGYENGLFLHVLRRTFVDIVVFNSNLQVIVAFLNAMGSVNGVEGIDEDALEQLEQNDDIDFFALEDVHVERGVNQLPNIVETPVQRSNKRFVPLTKEELDSAKGLNVLSDVLEAYTDLHQRLTALDADIEKRGANQDEELETVDDEVITYGVIKEPALLVKQYQDEKGKWRAIPGLTKIIDKTYHQQWLREHNSHPATREPIDQALPYKGRPARYRMRNYQDMNDAQELIEASILIRRELPKLNPANIQPRQVFTGVRGLLESNGLFSIGSATRTPTADIEEATRLDSESSGFRYS